MNYARIPILDCFYANFFLNLHTKLKQNYLRGLNSAKIYQKILTWVFLGLCLFYYFQNDSKTKAELTPKLHLLRTVRKKFWAT